MKFHILKLPTLAFLLMVASACNDKYQLAKKGEADAPNGDAAKEAPKSAATISSPVTGTPNNGDSKSAQPLEPVASPKGPCGIKDPQNPQEELFYKELRAAFTRSGSFEGTPYVAYLSSSYTLGLTQGAATLTRSVATTRLDAGQHSIPQAATDLFAKDYEPYNYTHSAKLLTAAERSSIFKDQPLWLNSPCTLPLAKTLKFIQGNKAVEVEFTPALPLLVLPKFDAKTYETELGDSIKFSDIIVKVLSSNDPALAKGQSISGGQVVIEKIAPERLDLLEAVHADLAYKITISFGTAQQMKALGLRPVTEYYIEFDYKSLRSVVFDSKDPSWDGPNNFAVR